MNVRSLPSLPLWAVTLAGGAVLLCAVALINGGPIIYPDTRDYLADGYQLIRLWSPNNTRPVFYGSAIEFLHWEHTVWPVLLVQGLVLVHLIYLTARAVGARLRPSGLLVVTTALAVLTPVSWYVSHVLPDVFAGVVVLTIYLLAFCRDRLTLGETVYLVLLGTAAISFHLTHLAIGAAVSLVWMLAWAFWKRGRPMIRPALACLPLLLALGGVLLFSAVLYRQLTLTPKSPPHLMARLIADGPGRDYLEESCGQQKYYLCTHLADLPDTENKILWRWMMRLPHADYERVDAEAGAIVRGTIKTYPLQVASHMLENTARQLVTIQSGMEFDPITWVNMEELFPFIARDAGGTLQFRGLLGDNLLRPINETHAAVAVASLLIGIFLAWRCLSAGLYAPGTLVLTVLTGLLANAFTTGALGGVFGRYEGRMIWLLPFSACLAGIALARSRVHARQAVRAPLQQPLLSSRAQRGAPSRSST